MEVEVGQDVLPRSGWNMGSINNKRETETEWYSAYERERERENKILHQETVIYEQEGEREQSCSYIKGSKIEYITFTLNEYEIRAILVKRIGEIILSVVE